MIMKLSRMLLTGACGVLVLVCGGCDDGPGHQGLRMNEIQVLGTHNSYHIQARDDILALLAVVEGQEVADSLEYTHLPLRDQLDRGVRQFELDIFADPEGGLYATRNGLIYLGEDPNSGLPELDEPGMKVLHIQDLDFETHCLTLQICLDQMKQWSDDNPNHLPIVVMIQAKEEDIDDPMDVFTTPIKFGPDEVDDIDEEIREVFPEERLITPDDVRGEYATLEQAVLDGNWPTLRDARGRMMFTFRNGGAAKESYVEGHPSLEGRVMFTNSEEGEAEAAWFNVNNALDDGDRIRELIEAGYLVRTRADEETQQAREDDYSLQEAAFASGGQFVSTDYVVPNPAFGTDYVATVPGDYVARCNPISAPPDCQSELIAP